MAASFLQYCAMCEKQILTPSNSILYCSEACRRKDSCKPLSLAAAAMSPPTTPPSSSPPSPRPILPVRTPTGTTAASTTSTRFHPDPRSAVSDTGPIDWEPRYHSRGQSEASRYLARFHRSDSLVSTTEAGEEKTAGRLLFNHRSSSTSIASMTTPYLSPSHTPSTASSSLSNGTEYDFNTRPLQSRQNPIYSASAGTTKGIELVMPFVAPPLALSLPQEGEVGKYEKRTVTKRSTFAGEGLGAVDWARWTDLRGGEPSPG